VPWSDIEITEVELAAFDRGFRRQARFYADENIEPVVIATLRRFGFRITAAAEAVDVPYRRAWEKLKEMEKRLGLSLLETEVGGAGGGGARLTAEAEELVARFLEFSNGFEAEVETRFERAFDGIRAG